MPDGLREPSGRQAPGGFCSPAFGSIESSSTS